MNAPITTAERYAMAATSDSLRPGADLDALTAAALATSADRRRSTAMALERMRATGDRSAIPALVHELAGWLANRQARRGRPAPRAERAAVAMTVLAHWFAPACASCNGLGFRRLDHAPALAARPCQDCHGAGRPGLTSDRSSDAQWLAAEIERHAAAALTDMARRMRHSTQRAYG